MRRCVLLCVLLCGGAAWLDIEELNGVSYEVGVDKVPQGLQHLHLTHLPTLSLAQLHHHINARSGEEQEAAQVGMTSEYGQKFVCSLPKPAEKEASADSSPQEMSPAVVSAVLAASFYVRNCVIKNTGWWTYELCHGKYVNQVHLEGSVVVGDPISLGNYSGDSELPELKGNREEQLYSEQLYTNGSVCDLNGQPRKTLVQYVCDEALSTHEAYIEQVEERASCEYVFRVRVGSLCTLTPFRAVHTPSTPLDIQCRPVLDAQAASAYLLRVLHTHNTQVQLQTQLDALVSRAISLKRQIVLRDRLHVPSDSTLPTQLHHSLTQTVLSISALLESPSGAALRVDADALTDGVSHFEAGWDNESDLDRAALHWYWHDPHFDRVFFPVTCAYARACNNYYSTLSAFYKRFGEHFDYTRHPYYKFIQDADSGKLSEVDLVVLIGPLHEVLREDDLPGIVPRQNQRDDEHLRGLLQEDALLSAVSSELSSSLMFNLSKGHAIDPSQVMSKCARQLLKIRSVANAQRANAMSYSQLESIYLHLQNVYLGVIDVLRISSPQLFVAGPDGNPPIRTPQWTAEDGAKGSPKGDESAPHERSAKRRMQHRAERIGVGRKLDEYFRRPAKSTRRWKKGTDKDLLEMRMNVFLQHLTEQFKETGIADDEVNIRLVRGDDEDGRLLSMLDAFLEEQTHLYSERSRMSQMEDAYAFGASAKTSHSPAHNPSLPILTRTPL